MGALPFRIIRCGTLQSHRGVSVTRRPIAVGVVLPVLLAFATACTSSSGGNPSESPTPTSSSSVSLTSQPVTPSSSVPTTPKSTAQPEATVARSAYGKYTEATYDAERSPQRDHNAVLTSLAIDPALGTFQGLLTKLQLAGIANRGTPPRSRVKVTKTDLNAKPWPTVTIVDCPTVSSSWVAYDVKTGKPVKVVPNPVNPPYAVTATVIRYKGTWVVYRTKADRNHTCVP
jgi:hypothetical protein